MTVNVALTVSCVPPVCIVGITGQLGTAFLKMTMTSNNDAMTCPFCGSNDIRLTTSIDPVHQIGRHKYNCSQCFQGGCDPYMLGWNEERDAMDAWNTRDSTKPEAIK